MRPYRIGTSSLTRVADCRSITPMGSRRSAPTSYRPCPDRDTRFRAPLPYAALSSGADEAVNALGIDMAHPPPPADSDPATTDPFPAHLTAPTTYADHPSGVSWRAGHA
ncbi:hypothetical protein GCM10018780_72040 [Streptomyces lanatus]|nr:hypothetical protein GCM10018780_72040 [Streptomyces lanatus]